MAEFDSFWTAAAFEGVLTRHNAALTTLSRWRTIFTGQATAIASFVHSYPGMGFSQADIESAIRRGSALPAGVSGTTVYRPWQGWWCGDFHSPGSRLYTHHHVWDETVSRSGVYVQPVTQSVTRFVGSSNLTTMLSSNKVDLAINVLSSADGLTGWVSKRQWGSPTEHPHIAYYLDATHVLWVTQTQGGPTDKWFLFFEWSNGTLGPTRYGIHGRELQISGGSFTGMTDQHYGTYRSQPIGSTTCPASSSP